MFKRKVVGAVHSAVIPGPVSIVAEVTAFHLPENILQHQRVISIWIDSSHSH